MSKKIFEEDDFECYYCSGKMDNNDSVLVCRKCGYSIDLDDYWDEADEYELYPDNRDLLYDENEHENEEFPGEGFDDV